MERTQKPVTNIALQEPLVKEAFDMRLSPSRVEVYLDCPYRWFLESVVKVNELEWDYGARDRGSIAHETLNRLIGEAMQSEAGRITPENLAYYANRLDGVFEECQQEYFDAHYANSDIPFYVREDLARLKVDLKAHLAREAVFLPGFKPWLLEAEVYGVYAGQEFKGIVDRVDKKDDMYVVIDYKTGTLDSVPYWDPEGGVNKIQTALYATLIQEQFASEVKRPVGALYVSLKDGSVGGALDATSLDPEALQLSDAAFCKLAVNLAYESRSKNKVEKSVYQGFNEYLREVEDRVGKAIAHLRGMDISKHPGNKKGAFCPVVQTCGLCEVRRSYGR